MIDYGVRFLFSLLDFSADAEPNRRIGPRSRVLHILLAVPLHSQAQWTAPK
jgi:hypothetical protein